MTHTEERARYVRAMLAYHGVTQADLAALLGCTQTAVSKKLKGQREFKAGELLAIAEAYGLDPGLLLRPPSLVDVLGTASGGSSSAWTNERAA